MIFRAFELTVLAVMLAVAVGVHLAAKRAGYDVFGALRRMYDRSVAWVLATIRRFDR